MESTRLDENTKEILVEILSQIEKALPKVREVIEEGKEIIGFADLGTFWINQGKVPFLIPGIYGVRFWKGENSATVKFRLSFSKSSMRAEL